MSLSFNAFGKDWDAYGLKDYCEFADCTTDINVRDDGADCTAGTWYWVDPDPHTVEGQGTFRVIYWGTWGNYNSPGASSYTNAELYDLTDERDMAEFAEWETELEGAPEWAE